MPLFPTVPLSAFGTVTTSGSRKEVSFQIHFAEDNSGWAGRSSLLVSLYAPAWVALLEPKITNIAFGVQSTHHTTRTFVNSLGMQLKVYQTTLVGEENVYITKSHSNQSGYTSICAFIDTNSIAKESSNNDACTTITANFDQETSQIASLTGRFDFITEKPNHF